MVSWSKTRCYNRGCRHSQNADGSTFSCTTEALLHPFTLALNEWGYSGNSKIVFSTLHWKGGNSYAQVLWSHWIQGSEACLRRVGLAIVSRVTLVCIATFLPKTPNAAVPPPFDNAFHFYSGKGQKQCACTYFDGRYTHTLSC